MTSPATDWTAIERKVIAAHNWHIDSTGRVRSKVGNGPIPMTTVLATLATTICPRTRPVPEVLTAKQRAFLGEHGLTVDPAGAIVTADTEPISTQLLQHLLTTFEAEHEGHAPTPFHHGSRVARAMVQQSTRTPWG